MLLLGWEAGTSSEPELEAWPEILEAAAPTAPYGRLLEGLLYAPVAKAEGVDDYEVDVDSTTDSEVKDQPGMLMLPVVQVIPSSLVMEPSTSVPRASVSE